MGTTQPLPLGVFLITSHLALGAVLRATALVLTLQLSFSSAVELAGTAPRPRGEPGFDLGHGPGHHGNAGPARNVGHLGPVGSAAGEMVRDVLLFFRQDVHGEAAALQEDVRSDEPVRLRLQLQDATIWGFPVANSRKSVRFRTTDPKNGHSDCQDEIPMIR